MHQSKGVAEFVYRFFFTTLVEQPIIRGEAVELLPKPVNRHHRSAVFKLSFSKDKSEHRNKQVNVGDPQKTAPVSVMIQQLRKNLGRVVLPTDRIEGVSRISCAGADYTVSSDYLTESGWQELEDVPINASDRHQLNLSHGIRTMHRL